MGVKAKMDPQLVSKGLAEGKERMEVIEQTFCGFLAADNRRVSELLSIELSI